MSKKNKKDIYREITTKIIEQLEKGVLPWRRPYALTIDKNGYTGRPYRGINLIILTMHSILNGFNSPLWLTFKEVEKLGGSVKRGPDDIKIVFFKSVKKIKKDEEGNPIIDPKTGEPETIEVFFVKWHTVVNIEQTENITLPKRLIDISPSDPTPLRDAFFSLPIIRPGKIPAYVPTEDIIQMPLINAFKNPDEFWASYFHELVHWTGAPHRLNRNLTGRFGDYAYAFEELIAEIGSAFLCRYAGVNADYSNSVSYINSWIKCIKKDSKVIFTAASKAQKAVDWLLEKAGINLTKKPSKRVSRRKLKRRITRKRRVKSYLTLKFSI